MPNFNYYHTFSVDRKHFFYDGNTTRFYELDEIDKNKINDLIDSNSELLLSLLYKESERIKLTSKKDLSSKQIDEKRIQPNVISVNLSSDCNLRCKYCWNQQGTYNKTFNKTSISMGRLDEVYQYIVSECNEPVKVDFYGGEPLIDLKIAKYAIDLFSSICAVESISIVTNGTTLTPTFCKSIKNNKKLKFVISLDGDRHYNDESPSVSR